MAETEFARIRRRVLLRAVSPAALLAALPALSRSQRAWFVKLCAEMSAAMSAVPKGEARG